MSIDSVTGTTAYSSRGSAKRPVRAATVLHLLRRLDHSGEARMAVEFAAALNDIGGRSAIAYHAAAATHELQRHGIQPIEVKLGGPRAVQWLRRGEASRQARRRKRCRDSPCARARSAADRARRGGGSRREADDRIL
jgi:hypothetical protein